MFDKARPNEKVCREARIIATRWTNEAHIVKKIVKTKTAILLKC